MNFQTEEIVWPWKSEIKSQKIKSKQRRSVLLQVGIMLTMATTSAGVFHRPLAGAVLAGLALTVLIFGLFLPRCYSYWAKSWKRIASWIATVMAWGLLAPFYYLFFVPGHWILALGQDRLRRSFASEKNSYWSGHLTSTLYDRQF